MPKLLLSLLSFALAISCLGLLAQPVLAGF
jgi:hypothetical protein